MLNTHLQKPLAGIGGSLALMLWQGDWLFLIVDNCIESQFYGMPSQFFPLFWPLQFYIVYVFFYVIGDGQKCTCVDAPRYFCQRKGSSGTWLH